MSNAVALAAQLAFKHRHDVAGLVQACEVGDLAAQEREYMAALVEGPRTDSEDLG